MNENAYSTLLSTVYDVLDAQDIASLENLSSGSERIRRGDIDDDVGISLIEG